MTCTEITTEAGDSITTEDGITVLVTVCTGGFVGDGQFSIGTEFLQHITSQVSIGGGRPIS